MKQHEPHANGEQLEDEGDVAEELGEEWIEERDYVEEMNALADDDDVQDFLGSMRALLE